MAYNRNAFITNAYPTLSEDMEKEVKELLALQISQPAVEIAEGACIPVVKWWKSGKYFHAQVLDDQHQCDEAEGTATRAVFASRHGPERAIAYALQAYALELEG